MCKKTTATHKGQVIWIFGRPCSGKTTLSSAIKEALARQNLVPVTLDGDEIRKGMNHDLGFSLEDRHENIRRTSELASLLASKGFVVICSLVTPTQKLRALVKQIITKNQLTLVYVKTPLEVCISRDSKGHYSMARKGELSQFTGIGSPFEEPKDYDCLINTTELSPLESGQIVLSVLKQDL